MTHRFPIKEIALQAGLSTATIDRALNDRAHVSAQTQARVRAAISELEGQERQLTARGRRLFVDVVVEAPKRFSAQIRTAIEGVLPTIGPAVFRPRFTFQEVMPVSDTLRTLEKIRKRGSQGVFLKARDVPEIRESVDALVARGIPVITLFTDIPASDRMAYLGPDNIGAGRTAGYLAAQVLKEAQGSVLASMSRDSFSGEEDRLRGFGEVLKAQSTHLQITKISGGAGLSLETEADVSGLGTGVKEIVGVYSMGGGNAAILRALEKAGHRPRLFIAHDYDAENAALLRDGRVDFVLHHDLSQDMRSAFSVLAAYYKLLPETVAPHLSELQILTPMNAPQA